MKTDGPQAFERLQRLEVELHGAQSTENPSRPSVQKALAALVEFIDDDPGWEAEQLSRPLYDLMLALQRIDYGHAVDWLTPHYDPALPRISLEIEAIRTRCAVAQEWLMCSRPKVRRKDAALTVLHQLGQDRASALLPVRTGERRFQPVKWQEIARWRENVMADPSGTSAYQFHVWLKRLIARYGADVSHADAVRHCADIVEGAVKTLRAAPKTSAQTPLLRRRITR